MPQTKGMRAYKAAFTSFSVTVSWSNLLLSSAVPLDSIASMAGPGVTAGCSICQADESTSTCSSTDRCRCVMDSSYFWQSSSVCRNEIRGQSLPVGTVCVSHGEAVTACISSNCVALLWTLVTDGVVLIVSVA